MALQLKYKQACRSKLVFKFFSGGFSFLSSQVKNFIFDRWSKLFLVLQGLSVMANFELARRDRNMSQIFLEGGFEILRFENFASATSFHEIYTVRHLWSNLQTWKKKFGKKDFGCNYCKATS